MGGKPSSPKTKKKGAKNCKGDVSATSRSAAAQEAATFTTSKNKSIEFAATCTSFSETMKDVAVVKKNLRLLKKDFYEEVGGRSLGNDKLKRYKQAQEENDEEYNSSQESLMAEIFEAQQDIELLSTIKKKLQTKLTSTNKGVNE